MNKLQLREEKIDWLKLIKLALDKKGWGKKYIMYNLGTTTISCIMVRFDFTTETAMFKISVDCTHNEKAYSDFALVEYVLKNFTSESFSIHLYKRMIRLLEATSFDTTKRLANVKYIDLYTYSWNITNKQLKTAGFEKELKIIQLVKNNDIRKRFFSQLQAKAAKNINKDYDLLVEAYCKANLISFQGFDSISESMQKEVDKLTRTDSK